MPRVVLYTRPDCHLCDDVKRQLATLASELEFSVDEVNIESEPALRVRYGHDIPVVSVEGREAFRHRFDGPRLRELLAAH